MAGCMGGRKSECAGYIEPLSSSGPSSPGTNTVALEVLGPCQDHSLELVHMWTYLGLWFV